METKLVGLVVTNLAGSGAEKVVLNLFNMFEKFGHNVYVFLLEDLILYNLSENEKNKIITLTKNRKYHKLFSFHLVYSSKHHNMLLVFYPHTFSIRIEMLELLFPF